jgi:hypothetical protein
MHMLIILLAALPTAWNIDNLTLQQLPSDTSHPPTAFATDIMSSRHGFNSSMVLCYPSSHIRVPLDRTRPMPIETRDLFAPFPQKDSIVAMLP